MACPGSYIGRRDVGQDQVEQRLDALGRRVEIHRREARPGVGVDDGKLDLGRVSVLVEEQLVDLVDDLADARVGPVDLVHDEDHGQPALQRLAQHEPRLRQRPLARVDQQQHPVHHRQAALHLATEIGVARRVDDVDLDSVVAHRGVLGEDRDPPLALEPGVHHPVDLLLVRGERAGLAQHRVDQRRLAVVDVRDDGDVADVGADGVGHGNPTDSSQRAVDSAPVQELRMLTARAATSSKVRIDAPDSAAISPLASIVTGMVSVGLKAIALVYDVYR